jgi:hypothetical protein
MVSDREVSARLENDRDDLLRLDLVFRDRRVECLLVGRDDDFTHGCSHCHVHLL